MEIIYGLQNGMVMQRSKDGFCDIKFAVKAKGELSVSNGKADELPPDGELRVFRLTGIPVGGPYDIEVRDAEESAIFDDIYVGDVWLLGGQSNMEGNGYYSDVEDDYKKDLESGIDDIRAFYFSDEWKVAEPRLHQEWLSKDPGFVEICSAYGVVGPEVQIRGVGPGYYFAKEMRRLTGVPQGLLPCAFGGSNMMQWDPTVKTLDGINLYSAMMRRFRLTGGSVSGMFWYQGCSETGPEAAEIFTGNMIRFCTELRRDTGIADLPFVQVQIFSYTAGQGEVFDNGWSKIREYQRRLAEKVENLDTVAVCTAELADCIHLDSRSQTELGPRAAESMYNLCFDKECRNSLPAPTLLSVRRCANKPYYSGNAIAVRFGNLHGRLISAGRPSGFALTSEKGKVTDRGIFRIELEGDTAYIYNEIPEERVKDMYLYYNYGCWTYSNITDEKGRPVPAFGPIPIE